MNQPADVVDLARVRAAEERIGKLLAASPHLRERTAAMLAGELECPDLEMSMGDALRQITIRLPESALSKADALADGPDIRKLPELAIAGSINRSDVLRAAVVRGLASIVAELEKAGEE